jgi:hypothetical protein
MFIHVNIRFYMLLKPDRSFPISSSGKNRLFTMTAKTMPDASKKDMKHCKVAVVSEDLDDITIYLGGLKCWQGIDVPAARPCGEGLYEIIRHGFTGPLHFIYELELPTTLGGILSLTNNFSLFTRITIYYKYYLFRCGAKSI